MVKTDEEFKTAIIRELTARGYSDIEIIGAVLEIRRGTAYGTDKTGARHKLRVIIPDNLTVIKTPHFRVKVIE